MDYQINLGLADGRSVGYQQFVGTLFKVLPTLQDELNHGALGVAGEAGEFVDAIKRHTIYGKELDRANVVEELGDLAFYMRAVMTKLDITWQEVLAGNIRKLEARYPAGTYSDQDALARADKVDSSAGLLEVPDQLKYPVSRLYFNKEGGGYFENPLTERLLDTGTAGDYVCYKMSDDSMVKAFAWNEDALAWLPVPMEKV